MARKAKPIDAEQVRRLAELGCKTSEIAAFFDVSAETIRRRFSKVMESGLESLRVSLRRMQIESAKAGSVPMQIWLGKQLLDQSDKTESKTELTAAVAPLQVTPELEETIARIAERQALLQPPLAFRPGYTPNDQEPLSV